MDFVNKILIGLGVAFLGLVVLVLVLRVYNGMRGSGGNRSRAVSKWSRGLKFSNGQLAVMRSLWQAYKHGRLPDDGLLSSITAGDLADLVKKSDLDFMPAALRANDEAQQRRRLIGELVNMGFDEIQAQIVTAMKFGKLGPANDS